MSMRPDYMAPPGRICDDLYHSPGAVRRWARNRHTYIYVMSNPDGTASESDGGNIQSGHESSSCDSSYHLYRVRDH